MEPEELEAIAKQIQLDKRPVKMTKRDFVEGNRCEKRTSGNVLYINDFLERNNLITIPNYEKGWIDEEMELAFKYEIKSTSFQLYSLYINEYKNLNEVQIDFESTDNYCCFIGLNGSGKSNILEAISAIFYSLYHIATLKDGLKKYPCKFNYRISYILNGEYFEIIDGKLRDENKITLDILPKNIIASYSGEDTRLWKQYYEPIYEKYCSKITTTQGFAPPFMFYMSKSQWEIALLTLIYSQDIDAVQFIKSLLGDAKATISFSYNTNNYKKWEGSDIEAFIDKLKEKSEYSVDEFRETISNINFIDQDSTLFYYLYRCSTKSESQVISKVNISFTQRGNVEGLSEGEKKMIIANIMIHILASQNSLCLFDEPDSHIHVSRKDELLKLISTPNRYSLLTTHSPLFVNKLDNKNIRHLSKGKIQDNNKIREISELAGDNITFFDGAFILSAPYTLIVEGTYDIKYIKRAIDIFSNKDVAYCPLKKIAYISMGSAGNAESFFNDVIFKLLNHANKIIYLFDYDKAGLEGWKKVDSLKNKYSKLENIFYQKAYDTIYPTGKISSPIYVEDLFDKESYSSIVEELHKKEQYYEFKTIKDSTCNKIKNCIERTYNTFDESFYDGFKPLLDKLLTIIS